MHLQGVSLAFQKQNHYTKGVRTFQKSLLFLFQGREGIREIKQPTTMLVLTTSMHENKRVTVGES